MTKHTESAKTIRLVTVDNLSVGDLVRMVDERSPFEVGIYLGLDEENQAPLLGALDGDRRFDLWQFDENTKVLRLVEAADLIVSLDTAQALVHRVRTPGVVSIDQTGLMMCFKEAGTGPRPTKMLSFPEGRFANVQLTEGSYLAYAGWSLGKLSASGDYLEIVAARA